MGFLYVEVLLDRVRHHHEDIGAFVHHLADAKVSNTLAGVAGLRDKLNALDLAESNGVTQ